MAKLLINSVTGEQKVIWVSDTGGYFDLTKVVWDTRVDGKMPELTLGKMQRSGNTLITLPDYLPEHAAWMAALQIEAAAEDRKIVLEIETKSDPDLSALRQMSAEEINAWFDLNVTNAAQLIKLLKKVLKVMIRKNML